jgi:hypothetical protein
MRKNQPNHFKRRNEMHNPRLTHTSVNRQELPTYREAFAIADKVWEATNLFQDLERTWRDYWHNSTPIKGIRTIRIRIFKFHYGWEIINPNLEDEEKLFSRENKIRVPLISPEEMAACEKQVQVAIANAKQILGNHLPPNTYKIYAYDNNVSIKIYYQSWQPGQPREYQTPNPDAPPADLPLGTKVSYPAWNGMATGTIVRRLNKKVTLPYYHIKPDNPNYKFIEKYISPQDVVVI